MLVDLSGQAITPTDDAPSMERGAQLLAELLVDGPEVIGIAFTSKSPAQRRQILEDLHALQMFLREIWVAMNNYQLANPEPLPDEEEK